VDIKENFKVLFRDLDISDLKSAILESPQSDWDENKTRQKAFPNVARYTETIMLKFNGPTQNIEHPSKTKTFDAWHRWKDLLNPIIDRLETSYPNSVISKCIFPKLLAGGVINKHVDGGDTLTLVHRVHVPIVTNEDTLFTCGGETINMKEGYAYEVNNQREHAVVNNGKTDRVHLLIDLYCGH
jgi:hypothetical protein